MPNALLVLTLLKISSRYQWYSLSILYLLLIVYLNISKHSCIESINISSRIVLKITKIAVAIRFVQQHGRGTGSEVGSLVGPGVGPTVIN